MAVFVSKEQYDQACSVDLYEFLLKNHSYAVKVEYGSVLLLADKHVSVKKGFHGYRNFRTGETGNNVDYLMNFILSYHVFFQCLYQKINIALFF